MSTQEQQVVDLLKAIETGAAGPVAVINPEHYRQHNLGAADGLAGFGALLAALPPNSAKVNTVRVFEDGDYVFAHTEYEFFGPRIGFDIFRFEHGKIVEHWDNLQETPASANPSGNTMIDGATSATDIDKTEANKVLGEGNFVLVVSEGSFGGKPTAFYDLFRVENGKIAEHWDTLETIPPQGEWKNQNGKFGF